MQIRPGNFDFLQLSLGLGLEVLHGIITGLLFVILHKERPDDLGAQWFRTAWPSMCPVPGASNDFRACSTMVAQQASVLADPDGAAAPLESIVEDDAGDGVVGDNKIVGNVEPGRGLYGSKYKIRISPVQRGSHGHADGRHLKKNGHVASSKNVAEAYLSSPGLS